MAQNENSAFLGKEKLGRLMLKFSVPCVTSLLISALYNVVDQIFIGNSELSTLGNAATGIVFPVFIIAQAFAWCFGDGCAAYLNICQGKNDAENAHKALGASITAAFFAGILMMAVIYPLKVPILKLFGASENTLSYAIEYLDMILAAIPIYILCNTMNSIVRADGSPAWAMISMITGAVVNLLLDPVFIFGFKWGMTGAALATVIGQVLTFAMTGQYLLHAKTFHLTKRSFLLNIRALSEVIKLGVSTFITQLTIVFVTVLCNVQLAKYGALSKYGADIPIAMIGIQSKIFTIVAYLVVGIVLGCQPIISYNMGARNYERVKALYRKITACTLTIGFIFTVLIELAPNFVVGIFGSPSNIPNPEDYWEFGEKTLRIFLSMCSISCLIKMNSIFFQAVGKPIHAIVASMIRDVVCFVPLIIVLPRIFMNVEAILYAAPIADVISMIVLVFLAISFTRSLGKPSK
jgi:putative MATE family efflux protein